MEHFIRDVIKCAVCLQTMVWPQQLRCLHSFCRDCIRTMSRNHSVKCPLCQAVTSQVTVVDDFKTNELIGAYRKSKSEYSGSEQTEHYRKTFGVLQTDLQTSLDTVTANNWEFVSVAIDKVRSVKRMWVTAFENEAEFVEKQITKRVASDRRVANLRDALGDVKKELVDLKRPSLSGGPSEHSARTLASRATATYYAAKVLKIDSAFPANVTSPCDKWANWDVTAQRPLVSKTVKLLLNPSYRLVTSQDDRCEITSDKLPGKVQQRVDMNESSYVPFTDPTDLLPTTGHVAGTKNLAGTKE